MVKSVSSLTRNGVRDYLLQRLSAAYLFIFLVGLVIYLGIHPIKDFYSWQDLFENTLMRVSVFFFFLSIAVHAWIGMWMVATDYLKDAVVRVGFMILVVFILLMTLVWGTAILWGL